MTEASTWREKVLLALDQMELQTLETLDHERLDWGRVERSAYLLHQRLRYDYPASIRRLRHRLVVIPPEVHGDQRRLLHRLDVRGADARATSGVDAFGNHVVDVVAGCVPERIEFEAWSVVERSSVARPARLPAAALADRRMLEPSALTAPDAALAEVARELGGGGGGGLDLAARINACVHGWMRYTPDCTDVRTTAADALALGRGVCQDYAHLMLALCRLCRLPARYVSGHLLGEGGSHAWVEVLVPDPDDGSTAMVVPFDPTHARQTTLSYVTVAVGRDYADVAPTSGTFCASRPGRLSVSKRLGVAAVELVAA